MRNLNPAESGTEFIEIKISRLALKGYLPLAGKKEL